MNEKIFNIVSAIAMLMEAFPDTPDTPAKKRRRKKKKKKKKKR